DASGNILSVYEHDQEVIDLWANLVASPTEWLTNVPNSNPPSPPSPPSPPTPPTPPYPPAPAQPWSDYDLLAGGLLEADISLAQSLMALPTLEEYATSMNMLRGLVGTLRREEVLAFVLSIPNISEYALSSPSLTSEVLSLYLKPILLSEQMYSEQLSLLDSLKKNDSELFYIFGELCGAPGGYLEHFPEDPSLLNLYRGLEYSTKLEILYTLASYLTSEHYETLSKLRPLLVETYSLLNGYEDFVKDLGEGEADYIYEQLQADAISYVEARYEMVERDELPLDSVKG